jgi:hypothetical protein
MNSRRQITSSDGFLPLLPVSMSPPVTSSPPATKRIDEPSDDEHYAVYGIKLWRWKISFQIPRRYSKVSQSDEEHDLSWKKRQQQSSSSLRANEEFFRQIEFPTGQDLMYFNKADFVSIPFKLLFAVLLIALRF